MFFCPIRPFVMFRLELVVAATLPAIILLIKVYKADKLEKESKTMLLSLAFGGVISTIIAFVSEELFSFILDATVSEQTQLYGILLFFVVVAISEEGAKYYVLYRKTWNNPEFNCQFDGVVYGIFVSLGFALCENIRYVTMYGLGTALVRAVTAIPGHACFGVFMGIFYGIAKKYDYAGREKQSVIVRRLGLLCAILLHGFYDYAASRDSAVFQWIFIIFVVVLFTVSYILVGKMAKKDQYIDKNYAEYEIID